MALECLTLRWTLTFLLCCKLFHSAWGDCGTPPVIPNTNPVSETSGKSGDTIVYSCDRTTGYYEIPGKSTTITCQDNGTWTVIEELCARGCNFPERLVYAEPTESSLSQNSFLPGTVYSYRCRPGYVRVPGTRASITCLSDYTWSTPETFCRLRSCGNPGEVENGNMEVTDFLFGSTVIYTCNPGYRLLNRQNTRQCQTDGTWSNALPQCDAVICPAPDKPDNAQYYPQKDEYTYLDSVTFSCQQPFQIVGEASISCTATGEWSSSSPICKDVNCPDPIVKNSRRLSGFVGPYKLNSAISFECYADYVLNGSSSITCNADNQWVPGIPKCEGVSCVHLGTIANGKVSVTSFTYNSKAIYTCDERYALTSSNFRICQANGTWNGSAPVCEATCDSPPIFHFASLAKTSPSLSSPPIYLTGTVAHYNCKPGFRNNTKEFTITCIDHSWSNPGEVCIPISCGNPGKIKNGHVLFQSDLFGSRTIHTCEEGFVRNSTLDYRECQADGRWTEQIICIEEKGLAVWVIILIVFGVLGVVIVLILVVRYFKKKQKGGKLQPDIPDVQYSHCKA
ncbi:C4b-binding protein alpha chain-like isoform X2 [Pyxicephalus adspersus]|uniref:Sushi domain-containing protein n=1 Tax=Pyxicephalus adspersus TaxID=30357 RepID=A0AAV3AY89_PYXAD|nr:TPA: hypothetical protein GDO54_001570 [Pyxicephalus adspersus]